MEKNFEYSFSFANSLFRCDLFDYIQMKISLDICGNRYFSILHWLQPKQEGIESPSQSVVVFSLLNTDEDKL